MQAGLEGIRVVEIAGAVGCAYAAKLFADLGADVIRLELDSLGDGSDVVAQRPHDIGRWLNTNKRSIVGSLVGLLHEADLLLHDLGPRRAAEVGLDFQTLSAVNAQLVVCSITPFGMTGPYADFVSGELNVIHGSSWGFLSPSAATRVDLPPLKAPGHHATLNAATTAATVALAAIDSAQRTGRGEHVDFAVFAAAAKMTETAPASASYQGIDASRLGVKIVIPWNIYPCRDGLVQFICPEQPQWTSFVELMGNPEWALLDSCADADSRRVNADFVDRHVAEWMAEQTVQDVCRRAQTARVCISPMNTMEQLDRDPHFAERGFFATSPDGLRLPGPGAKFSTDWWGIRSDAPRRGEHSGAGWKQRQTPSVPLLNGGGLSADAPTGRPLEGIRICDFTWIWAGPYCTQTLAHLGADVIKLESPTRTCMFRRLPYPPTGMALNHDTAGVFHLYNSDKRSVGIDFHNPAAREAISKLVAVSDVVIDNFGVGTMARLGFGADDLRRINPNVIVVSLSGYGQTGSSASNMAYGPVGGAVAGLYAANGYEGDTPAETGIAIGDPGTGIAGAWALMAALVARRRNAEVATIDCAMVEAVAATIGEPWLEWQTTGELPGPRGNRDLVWAPHNCYRAAGQDQWVTIACTSDSMWESLSAHIEPSLVGDVRFATAADRRTHEAELDNVMTSWTSQHDRFDITEALQAIGVAAFPSLSPVDLWGGNPQLDAIGMLEMPEHAAVGRRVVPGIPWRLTNGPNGLQSAAPLLGQHSVQVLGEVLGYSDQAIGELIESGAIWSSF